MGPGLKALAATAALILTVSGCSRPDEATPAESSTTSSTTAISGMPDAAAYADQMRDAVTGDAMVAHLDKLQEIADRNGGNRAIGTPGYEQSVDYVADALRTKGFDVDTTEFELPFPFADDPAVTVGGATVAAKPLE